VNRTNVVTVSPFRVLLLPWIAVTMTTIFSQWTEDNIYFVTRLKDNADFIVVTDENVPQNRNIPADQLIESLPGI
jgi:hypothetical protein